MLSLMADDGEWSMYSVGYARNIVHLYFHIRDIVSNGLGPRVSVFDLGNFS